MIISFDPAFNALGFEAENHAEKLQIEDLTKRLANSAAKWHSWDDMHGRTGIEVYVEYDQRKLES